MLYDIPVPRAANGPGTNNTVKNIIIALIIVFVIIVAYQIWKAVKTAGDAAGEIAGADIIAKKTGIPTDRQKVCKSVAGDCENAVTRIPFIGTRIWCTDDDVVNALNRLVSDNEAALTCVFFKQGHGDTLKSLVEGGLFVESNRKRITYRAALV